MMISILVTLSCARAHLFNGPILSVQSSKESVLIQTVETAGSFLYSISSSQPKPVKVSKVKPQLVLSGIKDGLPIFFQAPSLITGKGNIAQPLAGALHFNYFYYQKTQAVAIPGHLVVTASSRSTMTYTLENTDAFTISNDQVLYLVRDTGRATVETYASGKLLRAPVEIAWGNGEPMSLTSPFQSCDVSAINEVLCLAEGANAPANLPTLTHVWKGRVWADSPNVQEIVLARVNTVSGGAVGVLRIRVPLPTYPLEPGPFRRGLAFSDGNAYFAVGETLYTVPLRSTGTRLNGYDAASLR